MKISAEHHRRFGNTGLRIPPIVFGTSALANARRVIPDQTKFELFGEWFRHFAPPVAIDVSLQSGERPALDVLARAVRRFEITRGEVVFMGRFGSEDSRAGYGSMRGKWEAACRQLGAHHRLQLVAIDSPGSHLIDIHSPADHDRRLQQLLDDYRKLDELKSEQSIAGIGVAVNNWHVAQAIDSTVRLDWVMLTGCHTVMVHPPELLSFMASLAARQIPIVCAGIFHCDFLVGGSTFDHCTVSIENPADRSWFAWRKAFAALCHGNGISPVHACIQFALAAPGVAAVVLNTSRPERIAEQVNATVTPVAPGFWTAMKEERLLVENYPIL